MPPVETERCQLCNDSPYETYNAGRLSEAEAEVGGKKVLRTPWVG